jgi:hypothetical protein
MSMERLRKACHDRQKSAWGTKYIPPEHKSNTPLAYRYSNLPGVANMNLSVRLIHWLKADHLPWWLATVDYLHINKPIQIKYVRRKLRVMWSTTNEIRPGPMAGSCEHGDEHSDTIEDHLQRLGIHGIIILKWILEKYVVKLWTGFKWLMIGQTAVNYSLSKRRACPVLRLCNSELVVATATRRLHGTSASKCYQQQH